MPLEEALEPLALDTAFWLGAVDDPNTPIDQLGEVCLELEQKLSGLGIILLVSRGDSDAFLHNLIRAGRIWETFLTRCGIGGHTDDHNFCAGLVSPLVDAVAARDDALAGRIAAISPTQFRDGHESEDDFCYARAFISLFDGKARLDVLRPLLDRCAETGNSMSAARVEVLEAIGNRQPDAFEEAFEKLLGARRSEIAVDIARGQVAEPAVLAHRRVFVEGIALLNLAERFGIATQSDYLMCPSIARFPMVRPFAG